jgi:hypothetical protein
MAEDLGHLHPARIYKQTQYEMNIIELKERTPPATIEFNTKRTQQ